MDHILPCPDEMCIQDQYLSTLQVVAVLSPNSSKLEVRTVSDGVK